MAEEVNFEQLGPAVGQRFPALTFGTTGGTQIDLDTDRAGRPALVVFHRSARW